MGRVRPEEGVHFVITFGKQQQRLLLLSCARAIKKCFSNITNTESHKKQEKERNELPQKSESDMLNPGAHAQQSLTSVHGYENFRFVQF